MKEPSPYVQAAKKTTREKPVSHRTGFHVPDAVIQGDSGGICNTLGNDSMCDSKQKSSNEHGSDFERLRSYGHLLITVHALV